MNKTKVKSSSTDILGIKELASRLLQDELSLEQFLSELARLRTADLEEVQLDLDRQQRCGFPEVIFGEGKSLGTMVKLIERMLGEGIDVLATRVTADSATTLCKKFPSARYNDTARTLRVSDGKNTAIRTEKGNVAIVTAGTTDFPVAEEARETLLWMGVEPVLIQDVGVAGPHRLPERLHLLRGMKAVVVVAGMEGALPSVVGGYVACPVIAVPTSVGYGVNCGGLAALLSMLNSCAANVTVVNIDAGFKAGYVAGLIASRASREAE